jgi:hypothetical protein
MPDPSSDLILGIVYLLRDLYVDRQVMIATLQAESKKTRRLADWREVCQGLSQNPPDDISKKVAEKFQPLIDVAIQGLDDKGLAELSKHVYKLSSEFRDQSRWL